MIIIHLSGGLGNQMFQYAFGRALALRYGYELKLDANYYNSQKCLNSAVPRSYMLGSFDIKADLASPEEVAKLNTFSKKVIRKIKYKIFGPPKASLFEEKEYRNKDENYYVGVWQNERYFKDFAENIRGDFHLKYEMSPQAKKLAQMIDADKFSVCLQVRRGDNANNPPSMKSFGCPDLEYYIPAINLVKQQMLRNGQSGLLRLYVFSDDIEWVKNNLHSEFDTIYVSDSGVKTQEEITLMSKCRHNIISNSTFGWWGAWLNPKHDKIVVAPKQWALKNTEGYRNITPAGWIRV
jgi:hypothetical protein